ncbi:MAG: hypothetical protein HQL03_12155 [Nitrospirae bacterium]|nr:hypothetical protein [Nitrospirota bacterium]
MEGSIEITFPKMNHFWLDSGLLGLAVILRQIEADIKANVEHSDSGLTLKGTEGDIANALNAAYDKLIRDYYNLSTKKQQQETASHNFYYDSKGDRFISFPKKKAVGIAGLIYNKASRPLGETVRWKSKEKRDIIVNNKSKKLTRGILPDDYSHLQERMDDFLDAGGLDVTTVGLLVDGENAVRPKVEIPIPKGKKGHCFLCGEEDVGLTESNTTIFPFITGSSGVLNFFSLCAGHENICLRCAFIAKFAPVNGFYNSAGGDLFAFFPYSTSFEKMFYTYKKLQDAKYVDDNLYKNFQHPLGFEKYPDAFFQRPHEVSFAFLYTIYRKVLIRQDSSGFDWGQMTDIFVSKAPLEFVVLNAQDKGQVYMGKLVWPFVDSVYFFRLMEALEKKAIDIKETMRLLLDPAQKSENKTILRNSFCQRVLKKQSVIELIEYHVFSSGSTYIKPLLEFAIHYEPIIRKEDSPMTSEEQETAVTLGKRIGMVVAENGKKGDLFALRKARKKTDFLNELNGLQFKSYLTVPPKLYEGNLTDLNFLEFKQFCMIAALNSFNAATHK